MRLHPLRRPAPRAFFLIDLIMAVAMASALIISFSVAIGSLRHAQRRMADQRAAVRRLDQALLVLQSGGNADPQLQIERLADGPADCVWVRVSFPPPATQPGCDCGARGIAALPQNKFFSRASGFLRE